MLSPHDTPPDQGAATDIEPKSIWPYIAGLALVVATVVIVLPLINIYDGRNNNLEWARAKSLSQARVLSENASRALEAVDLILLDVAGRMRRNLSDPTNDDGVDGPCSPASKCHMVVVIERHIREEPSKWRLQR